MEIKGITTELKPVFNIGKSITLTKRTLAR
jgi:hypothetical protein